MKTNAKQKWNWGAVILILALGLGLMACGKSPETAGSKAPAVSQISTAASSMTEQTTASSAAGTSLAVSESQTSTSAAGPAAESPSGGENAAVAGVAASGEEEIEWALIALDDKALNLEKMLQYALLDEYHARDSYVRIMSKYGEIKPFSNIKAAEETHIELLLPLFETYSAALPDYTLNQSAFNGTLEDAYKAGVDAEVANIQMYEYFMKEELPDEVRTVFESLMRASEKHLSAFERRN